MISVNHQENLSILSIGNLSLLFILYRHIICKMVFPSPKSDIKKSLPGITEMKSNKYSYQCKFGTVSCTVTCKFGTVSCMVTYNCGVLVQLITHSHCSSFLTISSEKNDVLSWSYLYYFIRYTVYISSLYNNWVNTLELDCHSNTLPAHSVQLAHVIYGNASLILILPFN